MRVGKSGFRPTLWPTLAMLALCALFLCLADWQWHRGEYKQALLDQYAAQAKRAPVSLDELLSDPTLAMLALCALFLCLADWQWHRGEYKQALLDQYAAQAKRAPVSLDALLSDPTLESFPPYLKVDAVGSYDPARQVLLQDMTHDGDVGYEVLTPFLMQDGVVALVDRGWVAADAAGKAPDVTVRSNPRRIVAAIGALPEPGLKLGQPSPPAAGWPKLMFYPTLAELRPLFGPKLMTPVLHLDPAQPDGYVRDTTLDVGLPPARHWGYAFQWLMLAAAVFVVWLVVNLRHGNPKQGEA